MEIIKDVEDAYFPPVEEVLSSFYSKDKLLEQGSSEKPANQTVDEATMKSGRF